MQQRNLKKSFLFLVLINICFAADMLKADLESQSFRFGQDLEIEVIPHMENMDVLQNSLKQQRDFEAQGEWKLCFDLSAGNIKKYPEISDWVRSSGIFCARRLLQMKFELKTYQKALALIFKKTDGFADQKSKQDLEKESLKLLVSVLEDQQLLKTDSAKKRVVKIVSRLADFLPRLKLMDKDLQAKTLLAISKSLEQQGRFSEAYEILYWQDLGVGNSQFNQRAEVLKSKVPGPKFVKIGSEEKDFYKDTSEKELETKLDSISIDSDFSAYSAEANKYFQLHPWGPKIKQIQDQMIDYLVKIDEGKKLNDEQNKKLWLSLDAFESSRLIDMAKVIHRRQAYATSLRLAERAMVGLPLSQSPLAQYIIGRSASFLGDLSKAKIAFQKFVQASPRHEDIGEVLMRWAVCHLRDKEYAAALSVLDRLLKEKNADKYRLTALYWKARALEVSDPSKAQAVKDDILDKYPISYYGFKLKLEKEKSLQLASEKRSLEKFNLEAEGKFIFTTEQKKVIRKIRILGPAGWISEAMNEWSELGISSKSESRIAWFEFLSKNNLYFPLIKMTNEYFDQFVLLRDFEFYKKAYPLPWEESILKWAKTFKISPVLVLSLTRQESGFDPDINSSSNAAGLMQMIPMTAKEIAGDLKIKDFEFPTDMYRPDLNIRMGTYYLSKVIAEWNGNLPLGIASYNAGPHRVRRFLVQRGTDASILTEPESIWKDLWIEELPWFETQFYVKAILRNAVVYRNVISDSDPNMKKNSATDLWSDLVFAR